ncbi:MAG: hypothetical protein IJ309_02510 [Clostridia bacterium]|nr:hypothetical protein [Clostridia bacterium]
MKKLISILLVAIMCICIFAGCNDNTEVPAGSKLASNSMLYKLFVPEEWQINQSTASMTSAQPSDSEFTNVSVMYWSATADKNNYESFEAEYKEQLNEIASEVKFLEDGTESVVGNRYATVDSEGNVDNPYDGKDYVYVAKLGKFFYKYHVTVVLNKGVFYVITFTFPQDNRTTELESMDEATFSAFDSYTEQVTAILEAFKLL